MFWKDFSVFQMKIKKYNLQYLASGMKIDVHAAHRANDDARVCMEVFLRAVKDTDSVQK